MTDHILPAFIVFGVLLVIAIIGLLKSNAASERLHASTDGSTRPNDGRTTASPSSALPH